MPLSALIETFAACLTYLWLSSTLQLYVGSVLLLTVGLGYEVYARSVRLSFLDRVPLEVIERTHPHAPSLKVIVVTFLCSASLLIVALQTVTGLAPFSRPGEWIDLGAFFIITGAIGVLAETRWGGASDHAFAVVIGTALAFLVLVLRSTHLTPGQGWAGVFLLALVLCCLGLAWRMLARGWTAPGRTIALGAFLVWMLLSLWL